MIASNKSKLRRSLAVAYGGLFVASTVAGLLVLASQNTSPARMSAGIAAFLDQLSFWGSSLAIFLAMVTWQSRFAPGRAYVACIGCVICSLELLRLTEIPLLRHALILLAIDSAIAAAVAALLWGSRGGGWWLIGSASIVIVWTPVLLQAFVAPHEIVSALLLRGIPSWLNQVIKAILAALPLGALGIILETARLAWREYNDSH